MLAVLPGVGPEGGAEQSFLELAPALLDRGVALHLAVLSDYQTSVPQLERDGVVVHDLSGEHSLSGTVRALRSLTAAVGPDVVHATLWEATLPSQLAALGRRAPLLITWPVTPASATGAIEATGPRWKRRGVELVDAALGRISGARYHAVTSGVGRTVAAALRVDPARVAVGERGRDPSPYDRSVDRDAVRSSIGVGVAERMVLAVGRQDAQKGYPSLLRSFDQLTSDMSDVLLVIAGRRGADTAEIEATLRSIAHADRVRLLGQRDDVPELMAAADAVVCSSWREGAAGSLVEAMASGTPVVSVRLDGLEGVLIDGLNARVVDRPMLATAIAEVLSDRDLADRLGEGGRRTFLERFTIDRSADRMREVYRWAADAD